MMGHGWGWDGWNGEKSPGTAALLSLQPMPIDFGNFYVDDWRKGIIYTSLELGLFIPGITLMSNNGMGHWNNDSHWTTNERITFYSLLTGYIALKAISAYDAASTAEELTGRNNISMGFDTRNRELWINTGFTF
jgi:hypothetical protein